jgi:hypothetical protein
MQWLAEPTLAFGIEFWIDQMVHRLRTVIVLRKYQWADFSIIQYTAWVDLVFGSFRAILRPELVHAMIILLQLLDLTTLHHITVTKYEIDLILVP